MSALAPLALNWPLAQQGPDGPGGNILGWLIVFFMVVWPIIRGAVEAANERRRKFVEQERRRSSAGGHAAGPTAGPSGPTGRPTLEGRDPFEALRRALELEREAEERHDDQPPARPAAPPPPPPRVARPASQSKGPQAKPTQRKPAQRPHKAAPAYPGSSGAAPDGPAYHEREGRPVVVRPDTFGRDPFDDSQLERPLVKDADLARVPSEGGHPTETPQRRPAPVPAPPIDAPTPVIEPLVGALSSRGRGLPVGAFALERITMRVRTPWARAVLYEELLGPPVSLREPRL